MSQELILIGILSAVSLNRNVFCPPAKLLTFSGALSPIKSWFSSAPRVRVSGDALLFIPSQDGAHKKRLTGLQLILKTLLSRPHLYK